VVGGMVEQKQLSSEIANDEFVEITKGKEE
jgi:hypothetical protein